VFTHWLDTFSYQPHSIDVLDPGTQTAVQDYPGRVGLWYAGVSPSGPMDALAFRLANKLVGNAVSAAALEMIQPHGCTLRFNTDCTIALTGSEMEADLDGTPVPFWTASRVPRGAVLTVKSLSDSPGLRAYLAFSGEGLQIAPYLGRLLLSFLKCVPKGRFRKKRYLKEQRHFDIKIVPISALITTCNLFSFSLETLTKSRARIELASKASKACTGYS
jgi:hypothetical protein